MGTGIYTILIFAILGVFIAGLMIGRTPEYLGKKIEAREMKLASKNVSRHTPPGTRISIVGLVDGEYIRVLVDDDGPSGAGFSFTLPTS